MALKVKNLLLLCFCEGKFKKKISYLSDFWKIWCENLHLWPKIMIWNFQIISDRIILKNDLLNDSATHCTITWYAFAPEVRKRWTLNDTCIHSESFLVKFNYHCVEKCKFRALKNNTLHLYSFSSMLTNVPTFFK